MKKPLIYIVLALFGAVALSSCSSQSFMQTITLSDVEKDLSTEWSDGKLWAYKSDNDYAIGLAISSAKDDIGLKQLSLIVENKTGEPLVFDPHAILIFMESPEKAEARYTIEYPTRQNLNMSLYDSGENIYQLSKMLERGDSIKQIGYLKKNTIYPGNGIIGYSNFLIKSTDTGIMHVVVPVGDREFAFQWYAGAEFAPAYTYVSPKDVSIIDYSGDIKQELSDDKMWACLNDGNYDIKAALCTSQYDNGNYQLNVKIKGLNGRDIDFNPNKIEADFVSGTIVDELETYGFCSTKNAGHARHDGGKDVIGFMNIERRGGNGILAVNVPIGGNIYTFQWHVGGGEAEYAQMLRYVSPQNISIISNGTTGQEWAGDKLYAILSDDDYIVKAALCASQYDKKNFQLSIVIKDLNGNDIIFDPSEIVASFAKGQTVEGLKSVVSANQDSNTGEQNIYMNVERRRGNGILAVEIPIGGNIYTFQWHVGDIKFYRW